MAIRSLNKIPEYVLGGKVLSGKVEKAKLDFHADATALFHSMQAIAEHALHRPAITFFARRSDTTTLVGGMDATCSGERPSAEADFAKTAVA